MHKILEGEFDALTDILIVNDFKVKPGLELNFLL